MTAPPGERETMSDRMTQAKIRRKHKLPYRCECGGVMEYAVDFGRVFSACKSCTPTVRVNLPRSPNPTHK